jgi:hypothetical protein
MAGNGSASGDGKSSPYGSPSGSGGKGGGNDFVKNPGGAGDSRGSGNNFVEKPDGGSSKEGGNNFAEKPGGSMETPKQKTGTYRCPASVPAGGPSPFVPGGADPQAPRKAPKSGFGVGTAPAGPDRKPFKVSSK